MKFASVCVHRHDSLIGHKLMTTGFYNWTKVFDADLLLLNELKDLSTYDVLFVVMTTQAQNGNLLSRLRLAIHRLDKRPLIVATMDYAPEMWKDNFNLFDLAREFACADYLFGCEPAAASHMTALMQMNGINKVVPIIPHPVDHEAIGEHDRPRDKRGANVFSMLHRYENNWVVPYLVGSNSPDWDNILQLNIKCEVSDFVPQFMQNRMTKHKPFDEYIPFLSKFYAAIDSNTLLHTYGRFQVETACLRVPCIGSSNVAGQSILWPELTTDPNDVYTQRRLLQRLFDDEHFWNTTTQYARNKVREYGYEASKRAFMNLLENKDATKIQSDKVANQPA